MSAFDVVEDEADQFEENESDIIYLVRLLLSLPNQLISEMIPVLENKLLELNLSAAVNSWNDTQIQNLKDLNLALLILQGIISSLKEEEAKSEINAPGGKS